MNNLNLNDFVVSGEDNLYDLVCVCNHKGNSRSGHYYAYCRDLLSDSWYEYNDEEVRTIEGENVVTKYAYLLFYRKKVDTTNLLAEARKEASMFSIITVSNGSHQPSKWLHGNNNQGVSDGDEEDGVAVVQKDKFLKEIPKEHFTNYSRPKQIQIDESGTFVTDIGGFIATSSTLRTKQERMSHFVKTYTSKEEVTDSNIKPCSTIVEMRVGEEDNIEDKDVKVDCINPSASSKSALAISIVIIGAIIGFLFL
jgi:hypothetical protein